jgi:hypothetical protein
MCVLNREFEMKRILFLAMIFMSQFAYSENISLICSMVREGDSSPSFKALTFDTESKDLTRLSGPVLRRVLSLDDKNVEGTYTWRMSYRRDDKYDVEEMFTLNRTTLFISYLMDFAGNLNSQQGQCHIQNPQI